MAEEKKKNPPTEYEDDDFEDEDDLEDEEDGLDDEDIDEEDKKGEDDGSDKSNEDDEDDGKEEHDDEDDEEKKKKSKEEAQNKEERARQAQARREREAKEREAREEAIRQEAYLKAKLEANKVNTFTNQPIKDKYDLEVFEAQKALEAEGKDPTADLPAKLAEKERERAKIAKEKADKEKEVNDRIDREFNEFKEKYPNVKASEVLKDPDFKKFTKGRLGTGDVSLAELYGDFIELKSKYGGKKEEEDDGKRYPPSPKSGRKTSVSSYSKMSKADQEKVLREEGLIDW